MSFESWLLFSSIALVATITPGPAVLLVASHTIGYGTRRTFMTILGNISGLFIMSLLSVMGLGAMVLCSAKVFIVIKILGAFYLIFLGLKLWRDGFGPVEHRHVTKKLPRKCSSLKLYSQGLVVALTNPKAIAFTSALFPQFLDHQSALLPQFSILVTTFMAYSFICLCIYSRISAKTRKGIQNSRLDKIVSRFFASLFVGSGIGLGLST